MKLHELYDPHGAEIPGALQAAMEARRTARTLADVCMEEITRVRDHVMPAYLEIGRPGLPALVLMRATMDNTIRALAEGDATKLLHLLQELKGFNT